MSLWDAFKEQAVIELPDYHHDSRLAFITKALCDRVECLESEIKSLRADLRRGRPRPHARRSWRIGQRVAVNGWPNGTIAGTDRDGDPRVVHDGESIKRTHYAELVTPL